MVGVIGSNGAGKSTLLRLIGGVGHPDEGTVLAAGRIGALLELGTGFHPELTGRENVFVSGVISGLLRSEVAERFDDIVAFAELESFIDSPLRTYSTGMRMRLAFAVAIHIEPDILLVDEVLAVGDIAFQRKCLDRIARFQANGCAILLVTHDLSLVRELCDEVIWLHRGKIMARGPAQVIASEYTADMLAESKMRTPADHPPIVTPSGTVLQVMENRFGSLDISIERVVLSDMLNRPITSINSGGAVRVTITYHSNRPIPDPIFGLTISDKDGVVCYDESIAGNMLGVDTAVGQGQVAVDFERLDLSDGTYFFDVGIYERDWSHAYDYHWHVYPLRVFSDSASGMLWPPHHWHLVSAEKEWSSDR
jgi:lipopolysaccharide transport system ATP-binding protein